MIIILCLISCLFMFFICYLGTGSDEKNINGFKSYPIEVQNIIKNNSKYKDKIKDYNHLKLFISNIVVFSIILFLFGIFIKSNNFKDNFINILILGECINLFDLVVIDFIWFRNSKRVRFTEVKEPELYKGFKQHFSSFFRAIFLFIIVALIDGLILTII